MANYRVLVGLDYADKRAESGDTVSDIPAKSIDWLVEQGIIERVEETSKQSNKREQESPTAEDK